MVEHGATPSASVGEAREIGFKIVIFPMATLGIDESVTRILFRVYGLDESVQVDADAGSHSTVNRRSLYTAILTS